jgi:hypothetical protein
VVRDEADWNVSLPLWPDPEPPQEIRVPAPGNEQRPRFVRFRPAVRRPCGDCQTERHLGLDVEIGPVRWRIYTAAHEHREVCERHKQEIEERGSA